MALSTWAVCVPLASKGVLLLSQGPQRLEHRGATPGAEWVSPGAKSPFT